MGINVTNPATEPASAFVDGETMLRSTPGVPEEVVFMLREIEELSAQVDHLTHRVTEILSAGFEDVDGRRRIPGDPGERCGWGERRELGK
jgi:hypothetical protein